MEQISSSPKVFGPLTKLQCCPTSDGSAAAILASERFVRSHGLEAQAVEILGMEMSTDLPSTFSENSLMKLVRETLPIYGKHYDSGYQSAKFFSENWKLNHQYEKNIFAIGFCFITITVGVNFVLFISFYFYLLS